MFNPTNSELIELSTKMWSSDFLNTLTKLISDPIDIIISLTIVPVTPPVGGREEVIAGLISTGVEMNKLSSQYYTLNCGSLTVDKFYGAALDYSPYTKISIFLPYIGVRQLDVDEVMGKTLEVQYVIDLLSGACVAEILVGDAVLYSFNGNVASAIPVSSRSFDSLFSASINAAIAISGAVATGGATAGSAVSATANAVMNAKPDVVRSGNASANVGFLTQQKPYLIYEIPRQSMPSNNNTFVGYPSNMTAVIGDLSGFTQVSDIHLENIVATKPELDEIESILKEGIII